MFLQLKHNLQLDFNLICIFKLSWRLQSYTYKALHELTACTNGILWADLNFKFLHVCASKPRTVYWHHSFPLIQNSWKTFLAFFLGNWGRIRSDFQTEEFWTTSCLQKTSQHKQSFKFPSHLQAAGNLPSKKSWRIELRRIYIHQNVFLLCSYERMEIKLVIFINCAYIKFWRGQKVKQIHYFQMTLH